MKKQLFLLIVISTAKDFNSKEKTVFFMVVLSKSFIDTNWDGLVLTPVIRAKVHSMNQ